MCSNKHIHQTDQYMDGYMSQEMNHIVGRPGSSPPGWSAWGERARAAKRPRSSPLFAGISNLPVSFRTPGSRNAETPPYEGRKYTQS